MPRTRGSRTWFGDIPGTATRRSLGWPIVLEAVAVLGWLVAPPTIADLGPRPAGQAAWPKRSCHISPGKLSGGRGRNGRQPDDRLHFGIAVYERLTARFGSVKGAGQSVGEAPRRRPGQRPWARAIPIRQVQQCVPAVRCRSGGHRAALAKQHRRVAAFDDPATCPGNPTEHVGQSGHRTGTARRWPAAIPASSAASPNCTVIIAAGTVESTRLALDPCPLPRWERTAWART